MIIGNSELNYSTFKSTNYRIINKVITLDIKITIFITMLLLTLLWNSEMSVAKNCTIGVKNNLKLNNINRCVSEFWFIKIHTNYYK